MGNPKGSGIVDRLKVNIKQVMENWREDLGSEEEEKRPLNICEQGADLNTMLTSLFFLKWLDQSSGQTKQIPHTCVWVRGTFILGEDILAFLGTMSSYETIPQPFRCSRDAIRTSGKSSHGHVPTSFGSFSVGFETWGVYCAKARATIVAGITTGGWPSVSGPGR